MDNKKYTKEELMGRGIFALGLSLGIAIAFGFGNIALGPVIGFGLVLMIGTV